MTDPATFSRAFAAAFGAQDSASLAGLFAEDACLHGLTGHVAQGRKAIAAGLADEFAGVSRMARLVTGKAVLRKLGPDAVVLHQRFVVTGLRDSEGAELPRVGTLLTAVLVAEAGAWLAVAATFGVVEP